ncbi:MAG: Type 1 glutamine amidotransferase-like domain-containing protein [Acholeplasma sp.]|nr:Type 1 glutamine amidotransferase-like domain-containing protein [Acholeplasma sp.]
MINILMSRSSALTKEWAFDHLKNILKSDMKVVVLGFSFFGDLTEKRYFEEYGENSEYQEKIKAIFSLYKISNIDWIYYYKMSHSDMIKLIRSADILYYPGGAPDLMMKRIVEKNIFNELKSFDKIIIGSSAGAMIQLKNYHISPDNEYFKYSENEGLEYVDDLFIEVHFRRRRKQKSSMRKINRKYKMPIYVIPDDGMLIVNNKVVTTLNAASLYYNNGKTLGD